MKNLLKLALLFAPLLCSCSEDDNSEKYESKVIEMTRAEVEVKNASNLFAWTIFGQICNQTEGNVFISPLSAQMQLSMLANGTDGPVLEELISALGFEGMPISDVNSFNHLMLDELPKHDNKVKLTIANGLWLQNGYNLGDSYVNTLKKDYAAEVRNLDMRNNPSKAATEINSWCREKTNGGIDKIVETLSPETVMVLANAIYFKGQWKEPFNIKDTSTRPFTCNDGETSMVKTMYQNYKGSCNEFEGCKIAQLLYGKGRYRMFIILPDEGETVESCCSKIASNQIDPDALAYCNIFLHMPKFDITFDLDLNKHLPSVPNVSEMKQKAHITVDEEGTVAQTVTHSKGDLAFEPGSDVDFDVNRPFAFFIKEISTGTILFMGRVNKL